MKKYNKTNFYVGTKATFKACRKPTRVADYVSTDREGNPSSYYWYTEQGVYRYSAHWSVIYYPKYTNDNTTECGKISSCFWKLRCSKASNSWKCGFTSWQSFSSM